MNQIASLFNQGNNELSKGNILKAINFYEKVLSIEKKNEKTLNNIAYAYFLLGDYNRSENYILEAISQYKPRILVVEYNSLFGSKRNISIPYTPDFNRTKANYSNLYFGASLGAITYIAKKKGYILVGSNSSGVNAFYVRKDLMKKSILRKVKSEDVFIYNKDHNTKLKDIKNIVKKYNLLKV